MITNKDIESGNYSLNDVADIKMRLDYAIDRLNVIYDVTEETVIDTMCASVDDASREDVINMIAKNIFKNTEEALDALCSEHLNECTGVRIFARSIFTCSCKNVARNK